MLYSWLRSPHCIYIHHAHAQVHSPLFTFGFGSITSRTFVRCSSSKWHQVPHPATSIFPPTGKTLPLLIPVTPPRCTWRSQPYLRQPVRRLPTRPSMATTRSPIRTPASSREWAVLYIPPSCFVLCVCVFVCHALGSWSPHVTPSPVKHHNCLCALKFLFGAKAIALNVCYPHQCRHANRPGRWCRLLHRQ